jgi:thiamine-monophosphate kinase
LVRLGAGVGGCIDVSDGLVSDLAHLLERSGLGAAVESDRVPRPRGFRAACERLGVDADALALAGGEDYELLFTLRPATARRLPVRTLSRRLGVPVAEIGRVVREPGLSGVPEQVGWRHF